MLHATGPAPTRSRQRGFTLVELLITVAVAAILLTIAAPSFMRLMAKTDATQSGNDLVGDLALARNQAVVRQQRVCLQAVGGNWLDGWEVKADVNGDGDCDDAGDETIRTREAFGSQFTVTADRGGSAVTAIKYRPDGSIDGTTTFTQVKLCKEAAGHPQRVLVNISASGIASARRDATGGSSC